MRLSASALCWGPQRVPLAGLLKNPLGPSQSKRRARESWQDSCELDVAGPLTH